MGAHRMPLPLVDRRPTARGASWTTGRAPRTSDFPPSTAAVFQQPVSQLRQLALKAREVCRPITRGQPGAESQEVELPLELVGPAKADNVSNQPVGARAEDFESVNEDVGQRVIRWFPVRHVVIVSVVECLSGDLGQRQRQLLEPADLALYRAKRRPHTRPGITPARRPAGERPAVRQRDLPALPAHPSAPADRCPR